MSFRDERLDARDAAIRAAAQSRMRISDERTIQKNRKSILYACATCFSFATNAIFFAAVVASPVLLSPETSQNQIDGDNIAPKASIYPKPRP